MTKDSNAASRRESKSGRLKWMLLGFMGLVVVLLAKAVVTYFGQLPDEYRATVRFEVRRELVDYEAFKTGSASSSTSSAPDFVQTQTEIIRSPETLNMVIEKMKLQDKWQTTTALAYDRMVDNLEVEEEPGTDILKIHYSDHDEQSAVDIANGIAAAYQDRRRKIEKLRAERALASLEATVKKHKESVEDARLKMLEIARKYGVLELEGRTAEFDQREYDDTKKEYELSKDLRKSDGG